MKSVRKTKSGAVDRRSETSARNVSKARDVIARYVTAGKRCLSDEEDSLVIEESSASECESPAPQAKPKKKTRPPAARSPEPATAVQPWEAEISSLRAELAMFREHLTPQTPQAPTPPARTPLQEHQHTVAAIRRSILLKF
jgi:hypothetical protein